MATTTTLLAGGAATLLLLACSAFFSSTETAIFSLPAEWIDEQAASGDRRARLLDELADDPHRLLVTILVGNNVVNVAISSIVTVLLVDLLPAGYAVVGTTVLTSTVILVFGEIVPKSLGLGYARQWALAVAPVVRLVETALSPLIAAFDVVTRWLSGALSGNSAIEDPYLE